MPKNVTVSVSDDLASKMEELQEVNWSQVARTAFTQYTIQRQSPDMAELLETLKIQKGVEYVKGREFADNLVKRIGYGQFDILMQQYDSKTSEEHEKSYYGQTSPFDRILSDDGVMLSILKSRELVTESSQSFLNGLIERLQEIYKALQ